jgi:hypothetical protein
LSCLVWLGGIIGKNPPKRIWGENPPVTYVSVQLLNNDVSSSTLCRNKFKKILRKKILKQKKPGGIKMLSFWIFLRPWNRCGMLWFEIYTIFVIIWVIKCAEWQLRSMNWFVTRWSSVKSWCRYLLPYVFSSTSQSSYEGNFKNGVWFLWCTYQPPPLSIQPVYVQMFHGMYTLKFLRDSSFHHHHV